MQECNALLQEGYKVYDVNQIGFWSLFRNIGKVLKAGREIGIIYQGDKKQIMTFEEMKQEAQRCLTQQKTDAETQAGNELGQEWEVKIKTEKENIIQEQIDSFARSSKMAEGQVEGVYEKLKNRLIAEYIQEIAKKERTPQEIKTIKKTFLEKGKADFTSFIGDAYNRTAEGFGGLMGDLDEEAEIISGFFRNYGVEVSPARLRKSMSKAEYKKALAKKKGFADYLLDIIIKKPWIKAKKVA